MGRLDGERNGQFGRKKYVCRKSAGVPTGLPIKVWNGAELRCWTPKGKLDGDFNTAQIAFIKSQKLSTSMFFDGTGLSKLKRNEEMERQGKFFYFGGSPCKKGGHSLRAKSVHCIECDTSQITYQLRNYAKGFVYLAYSPTTKLIKIGYSNTHPQDRGNFLRKEAYGNIQDWDIKKIAFVEKDAGKTEFSIHSKLEEYQKPIKYEKNKGQYVECREIFKCELAHALIVFESIVT
jgi:hypothetical protein